jgi:uncharacterized protein
MATNLDELLGAIKQGDADAVLRMLDADPALATAKSGQGLSALMAALYYGQPKIADLIRARMKDLSIFEAAAVGDTARVVHLLEGDPSLVNAIAPDGFSALGFAAFFGRVDVVQALAEKGADPSAPSRNSMRVTPLHSAAANRDGALALKIAKILVGYGAQVNVVQHGGWTPLQQAAAHGNLELVRLLLDAGADPSLRAEDGRTALNLAQAGEHNAVARLLEAAGGDTA